VGEEGPNSDSVQNETPSGQLRDWADEADTGAIEQVRKMRVTRIPVKTGSFPGRTAITGKCFTGTDIVCSRIIETSNPLCCSFVPAQRRSRGFLLLFHELPAVPQEKETHSVKYKSILTQRPE